MHMNESHPRVAFFCSSFQNTLINAVFIRFLFVGEVSPYASTPRCARVCRYPLYGGSCPRNAPKTMVQSLIKETLNNVKTCKN
jgi:hypothetical protein